jgi:hypothetical protein
MGAEPSTVVAVGLTITSVVAAFYAPRKYARAAAGATVGFLAGKLGRILIASKEATASAPRMPGQTLRAGIVDRP